MTTSLTVRSTARPRRWLRALALIGAATSLALAGCSAKTEGKPTGSDTARLVTLTPAQRQHIRIYTVAVSSFHKLIETTGVVDYDNDHATSVLAPFSGPVARMLVSPGQHVKEGDALATVISPDFAVAVSSYRKAIVAADNARKLADIDKDLVKNNGVSQREARQAETDAASAEADRESALQMLESLKVDPETIKAVREGRPTGAIEGVIRSPVSGTVVEKLVTPGELLQAGTTPCFTVANLSRVWVMTQLSESELGSVSLGDLARVETGAAAAPLVGTVANIPALVNPDTRAVVARVVVDNPSGLLKKQMYVRVRIQARQEITGLLIPASAILHDDENLPFVYVVSAGGFARRHVTLGYRTGDQFQITGGLNIGDQVVVDGGIFVQFMQTQ
jgi:cobalt-zinc-cadmium efflux system membrane fusion protein